MKRIISTLLVILTLCGILAVFALAESTEGFDILTSSKYAKTYTASASGKTIPYTSKYMNKRGTVTYGASSSSYIANSSDELYLMDVGCTNGKYWAYVSYPTSSRRVNAYIPLSAITSNNAGHNKTTSTGKFYCSLREGSSNSSSYYVAKGARPTAAAITLPRGTPSTLLQPRGQDIRYSIPFPEASGVLRGATRRIMTNTAAHPRPTTGITPQTWLT